LTWGEARAYQAGEFRRLRSEEFSTGFTAVETDVVVEFARSGSAHGVRSGQTLLELAEEHGVNLPSSCRQGQCGTYKTKLLAGKARMDSEAGLDPDSKAQGFVLACVGHADGDVKLDA